MNKNFKMKNCTTCAKIIYFGRIFFAGYLVYVTTFFVSVYMYIWGERERDMKDNTLNLYYDISKTLTKLSTEISI